MLSCQKDSVGKLKVTYRKLKINRFMLDYIKPGATFALQAERFSLSAVSRLMKKPIFLRPTCLERSEFEI